MNYNYPKPIQGSELIAVHEFCPYGNTGIQSFSLCLYDTHKPSSRSAMRTLLAYELWIKNATTPGQSKLLFSGSEFEPSPLYGDDSTESIEALMGFLCLRPGDTDMEYFADYTPEQLEFCEQHAEYLGFFASETLTRLKEESEAEELPLGIIANLGDVNPLEHGGFFVENLGNGRFQAHDLEVLSEGSWQVHSFDIDRLEPINSGLVPFGFYAKSKNNELPHELLSYVEWFCDSLKTVSEFIGMEFHDLKNLLCSASPIKRAEGYRAVASYHGFENFDSYPDTYTSMRGKHTLEVRFLGKQDTDILDYSVCTDCFMFHHGNECDNKEVISKAYNEEQERTRGFFADNTDMECEEDSGYEEFSWRQCDLCRSHLGGSRYRLSIVLPNKGEN